MRFDLQLVLRDSETTKGDEFVELVKSATTLFQSESGRIGNFEARRRLIKLYPIGEAVVIGDLHGDLESLQTILESNSNLQRLNSESNFSVIFLGDYGDRGSQSVEVYFTILRLKIAYPKQVMLLRGNHEGPEDLMASPHDLPLQLLHRFKEQGPNVYAALRQLFNFLSNALIIPNRFLMVHGGISPDIRTLHDLANAGSGTQQELLEDLLWSDPADNIDGTVPSPRGAGLLFGQEVTKTVLSNLGVRILIRGHEPADQGYKIDHDGKVLTLFSRKGPPYFNTQGAFLSLPLSEEFTTAHQLIPKIHTF